MWDSLSSYRVMLAQNGDSRSSLTKWSTIDSRNNKITRCDAANNSKNTTKNDDTSVGKKQSPEALSFLADKTSRPIWSTVSTWLTVLEKADGSIRHNSHTSQCLFLSFFCFSFFFLVFIFNFPFYDFAVFCFRVTLFDAAFYLSVNFMLTSMYCWMFWVQSGTCHQAKCTLQSCELWYKWYSFYYQ